jgi:hypothetical protein
MADKPRFALAKIGPNATAEEVLDLFRKLTGKEPTQAEIDELKAEMVMQQSKPQRMPLQPDAGDNADWPKRTQDVKTPRV